MSRHQRYLNNWEMGALYRFLGLLNGMKPNPTLGDGWEWIISKKGRFTSKSLYLELIGNMTVSFPYKGIWISGIP